MVFHRQLLLVQTPPTKPSGGNPVYPQAIALWDWLGMPFRDLTCPVDKGHTSGSIREPTKHRLSITYAPPPRPLELECARGCAGPGHDAGLPGIEHGQTELARSRLSAAGFAECGANERKFRQRAGRNEPN